MGVGVGCLLRLNESMDCQSESQLFVYFVLDWE